MSTGTPEPIQVHRASAFIPVSQEMLEEAQETRRVMDAYMALSPEERAEAFERRQSVRASARAARHAEARRFVDWLRSAVTESPFASAHLEIIDEHQADDGRDADTFDDAAVCSTCAVGEDREGDPYPCRTLRALAKAYGWSP